MLLVNIALVENIENSPKLLAKITDYMVTMKGNTGICI